MTISFDAASRRTFHAMMMGPCHSDEPRPPTWMNWGYETGAAYGQPASEGYGGVESAQLGGGGIGMLEEFDQHRE